MSRFPITPSRLRYQSMLGRFRLGFVLLLLAITSSAVGVYLWREFQQFSNAELSVPGEPITIEFERGGGLDSLLSELRKAGINVGERWQWRMLIRQLDLGQKLQAGEYLVRKTDTPRTLLFALASGEVVQHTLTIIEGTRFSDIRKSLAAHRAVKQTIGGLNDVEVMQKIGAPEIYPEGLFLPETYRFPKGYTDIEILRKAYWDLQRALKEEWENRTPGLPLANPYEALILASIVEKETAKAEERPQIAGVFIRRLKLNMRLQTDPTVIYGMGESYDGNIRRKDLTTDTPYNTYTRAGLTPTPIASAGRAAIHAALNPDSGKALYFVAKGNGSHQFSETYEQHDRAVDTFQR